MAPDGARAETLAGTSGSGAEASRALVEDSRYNLAHVHLRSEDLGAAVQELARVVAADPSAADARNYMRLEAGQSLEGEHVDVVFIGSCTNSRLSDLRAAASIMRGRKVPQGTRVLVVPGSEQTRREAEAEGLKEVFIQAGAEWRQSGCSMCLAMNGDLARPGELVVSTSNRNFKGRQGRGARTVLASPLTAAASAVTGQVTDPRSLLEESA